jgi:N-acetylmuramoyl-L-alanine amidase
LQNDQVWWLVFGANQALAKHTLSRAYCARLNVHAAIYYRRANYLKQEALSQEALALARESRQPQVIVHTLFNRYYTLWADKFLREIYRNPYYIP